jgi:hypothetical protein
MAAQFTLASGYVVRFWDAGVYVSEDGQTRRVDYRIDASGRTIDIDNASGRDRQIEVIARAVEAAHMSGIPVLASTEVRNVRVIGRADAGDQLSR